VTHDLFVAIILLGSLLECAPKERAANPKERAAKMSCKACQSDNQTLFPSELCIHFPGGLDALDKEQVFVFPYLLVCLDCGFTECTIPEAELRRLVDGSGDRGTND
jgi:hypothetical protein